MLHGYRPFVFQMDVPAEHVVAILNGRDEHEALVDLTAPQMIIVDYDGTPLLNLREDANASDAALASWNEAAERWKKQDARDRGT
jgi:hypothetical protein